MPRIQVQGPDTSPLVAEVYQEYESQGRQVPEFIRILAAKPQIMHAFHQLGQRTHFSGNRLGPRLVHFTSLVISTQNRCAEGIRLHSQGFARALGITEEEARDLASRTTIVSCQQSNEHQEKHSLLTLKERAILDYATLLNQDSKQMREHHLQALRAVGMSDEEILELVWVAALTTWMNRVSLALVGPGEEGEERL